LSDPRNRHRDVDSIVHLSSTTLDVAKYLVSLRFGSRALRFAVTVARISLANEIVDQ
jgi:hypothetical protein